MLSGQIYGLFADNCDLMKIEEHFQFAQDELNPYICSRNVSDFCRKNDIPFVVYSHPSDQREFEITTCFDNESQEGSLLLDFLSNVLNFREVVAPPVFEEFRDYLKNLATFRDGKAFLYYDCEYILMSKIKT